MASKRCPLHLESRKIWAGEDQVTVLEPQPCIESDCAWWSTDRCGALGIPGELLSCEPIERVHQEVLLTVSGDMALVSLEELVAIVLARVQGNGVEDGK